MAKKQKKKQHRNRPKKFTKRILLPMTPEFYAELVDQWDGSGSLVGFIRHLLERGLRIQPKVSSGATASEPGLKPTPAPLAEKADAL